MAALLGALVLVHLALPWGIRSLSRAGREWSRGVVVTAAGGPRDVYGYASIGLGALAAIVVSWGTDGAQRTPLLGYLPVVGSCAAFAVGAAIPLLMARAAGRPRRPFRLRPAPTRVLTLLLCAAAEEVLWRAVTFGSLEPAALAAPASVLGFALLHLPRAGWRRLPYQLVFGTVLLALAGSVGLIAAVACHFGHNLMLATSTTTSVTSGSFGDGPRGARAPALPPSCQWGPANGSSASGS